MATGLQPAVRSTTLDPRCDGTSGSRTHRSPGFEPGRFAGLRTVPIDRITRAPPMGLEPTISTLTGWRALRAAPRGRLGILDSRFWIPSVSGSGSGGIRTLSISRSEREWSAGCLPSRLLRDRRSTQGGTRTHTRPGLSRTARPVGVPGLERESGSGGTRTHKRAAPPPVFKTGP